jgi:hypothetical protein
MRRCESDTAPEPCPKAVLMWDIELRKIEPAATDGTS